MATQLIAKGEVEDAVGQLIIKEKAMTGTLEKLISQLPDGDIRTSLKGDLAKRQEYLMAMQSGFVPINVSGFIRTDTKDSWSRASVKRILATMPEEARTAWDEAKALGIFKNFSITRGGDPVLAGNAGGKRFLIAAWIPIVGGAYVGFRYK